MNLHIEESSNAGKASLSTYWRWHHRRQWRTCSPQQECADAIAAAGHRPSSRSNLQSKSVMRKKQWITVWGWGFNEFLHFCQDLNSFQIRRCAPYIFIRPLLEVIFTRKKSYLSKFCEFRIAEQFGAGPLVLKNAEQGHFVWEFGLQQWKRKTKLPTKSESEIRTLTQTSRTSLQGKQTQGKWLSQEAK